jgi:two-component system phosphate regulon response regulator PhoB
LRRWPLAAVRIDAAVSWAPGNAPSPEIASMELLKRVLLVEDDAGVAGVVRKQLEGAGFTCSVVADGQDALAAVARQAPDLVLVDRGLPHVSGDDVVRALKRNPATRVIPVIVLSGRSGEESEIESLEFGADDYLGKPFTGRVLLARIDALLRRMGERAAGSPGARGEAGLPNEAVVMDRARHRVLVGAHVYSLEAPEYRLLAALVAARGFVVDGASLGRLVLGREMPPDRRDVAPYVAALRAKLGPASECIQEIRGAGYAFCPPPHGTVQL